MSKIIKKYAEIDYTGCCGASGKEYYEILCPEYFSGNDELETSLEQLLEEDLAGGCSQCCGSLTILDELENADLLVVDTVDYTKNKESIVFKDNLKNEDSSYSLEKLIDSLKSFEIENQPKHYLSLKYRTLSLELENIDKTRFKGDLCLCPELIDNKTMVLKGFLEEIVSNESKEDINYCSENYKTITLEKNWRYEYYSKSIASFLGDIEIVEEKNQSNIEKLNDMKILLELEDLKGIKVRGYLSFYPEFDKDKEEDDRKRKVVLKGFVEEIIHNI